LSPTRDGYYFKHAMMSFDYKRVVALNFRWMRTSTTDTVRVRVLLVEALRESDARLCNPVISIGKTTMRLPVELRTDDYAEFSGTGDVRVFDANGKQLTKPLRPVGATSFLRSGTNQIALRAEEFCPVNLTVITTGKP